MDLGIEGKTALVVGGTGDIGRAIVVGLARERARVAVVGRNPPTLAAAVRDAEELGSSGLALEADVNGLPAAGWAALREGIEEKLGPVDILVHAAAAPDRPHRIPNIPEDHWAAVVGTDLAAAWRASAAVLPGMAHSGWGRIVALGSLLGSQGGMAEGAYAAAKAGLGGLVKTIAQEYARHGVTANLVVPGRIATARTAGASEHVAQALRRTIPLRREGTPGEVAAVVVFLVSAQASYVTGAEIPVTGGRELGMVAL